MLNVEELENRYKKYKNRSRIPLLTAIVALSAVVTMSYFFMSDKFHSAPVVVNEPKYELQETAVIKSMPKKQEFEEQAQNSIKPEINKEESPQKAALSPYMNFIQSIKPQATRYASGDTTKIAVREKTVTESKPIVEELHVAQENTQRQTASATVEQEIKEAVYVAESKNSINIKRRDDEEDIRDVIKRFNNNHNPALSLFVAKKYYLLNNYEQAYNYALITNEINNDIEQSWIIFAKSLVKLNQKDKAVQTLKRYIEHSSSSQARQLLEEILSGKFK